MSRLIKINFNYGYNQYCKVKLIYFNKLKYCDQDFDLNYKNYSNHLLIFQLK